MSLEHKQQRILSSNKYRRDDQTRWNECETTELKRWQLLWLESIKTGFE